MSDSDSDSGSQFDDLSDVGAADTAPFGADMSSDGGDALLDDDDALNQSEIDDLFGVSMEDEQPTTGLQAIVNNSTIQHKRLPLLDACFDRLVQALNESMRNLTSDHVELSLVDISSVRFGSYVETIPLPALISVFKAVEWSDCGLITVNSPLVYSLLDKLLGGRRAATSLTVEGRSFTNIEMALIERMVDLILKEMTAAFKPLVEVEFRHERMESNPSQAMIAYPTDSAFLFNIEVDMEDRGGRIEILIPYPMLEPARHLLQQMFMGQKFGRDEIWEAHWTSELLLTDIELDVLLGERMLPLSEIMGLQVGSTLQLHAKPHDFFTLRCGDTRLLRGKVGRVGDRVSIKVDDWLATVPGQAQSGHK